MSLTKWLPRCRQWNIEYGGYQSNHLTHNIVVMTLGGAPEHYIESWYDYYTKRLEPQTALADSPITTENWAQYINNERQLIPEFREFFSQQLTSAAETAKILSKYIPELLPGLIGRLVHPLIHTGIALEAQDHYLLAEALAYMSAAHLPIPTSLTTIWQVSGNATIIDTTLKYMLLAKEKHLPELINQVSMTTRYKAMPIGPKQRLVLAFLDNQEALATLDSIGPLGLPNEDIWTTLLEATALVGAAYIASDCEFVVIHGVTSLWSLMKLLLSLTEMQQRQAIAHWWRAIMVLLTCQRLPGLESTAAIIGEWRATETTEAKVATDEQWQEVRAKSWESEDEHVQKGVYCMWRWALDKRMPKRSKALFYRAAKNQVRAHPSGQLANRLWLGNEDASPLRSQHGYVDEGKGDVR